MARNGKAIKKVIYGGGNNGMEGNGGEGKLNALSTRFQGSHPHPEKRPERVLDSSSKVRGTQLEGHERGFISD
jgi:hypothetical protein